MQDIESIKRCAPSGLAMHNDCGAKRKPSPAGTGLLSASSKKRPQTRGNRAIYPVRAEKLMFARDWVVKGLCSEGLAPFPQRRYDHRDSGPPLQVRHV